MGTTGNSEAGLTAAGLRVAVVAARYNHTIVSALVDGAQSAWKRLGGMPDAMRLDFVPGAFELPLASRLLAARADVDAVVALGCVIRGDTAHFDYVAGQCAAGLMRVGLDTGKPVIFGVLTVETLQQALQRSQPDASNKGGEAVDTAVSMCALMRRLT